MSSLGSDMWRLKNVRSRPRERRQHGLHIGDDGLRMGDLCDYDDLHVVHEQRQAARVAGVLERAGDLQTVSAFHAQLLSGGG
jgi:hypothetical protein